MNVQADIRSRVAALEPKLMRLVRAMGSALLIKPREPLTSEMPNLLAIGIQYSGNTDEFSERKLAWRPRTMVSGPG